MSRRYKAYSKLNDEEKLEIFQDLHYVQNLSTRLMGEKLGVYANKIRRDAKRLGFTLRTMAEAVSMAHQENRLDSSGPHSEEVKDKISASTKKSWDNADESRRQQSRDNLKLVVRDEAFKQAVLEGQWRVAEEGSKLEHYLYERLRNEGFLVEFHKEHFIKRENLQIDLFLPKIRTAIEVDGPAHRQAIFDEASLKKVKLRDSIKETLLASSGYVLIRIPQKRKLYRHDLLRIADKLVKLLITVQGYFPGPADRLITLEIDD